MPRNMSFALTTEQIRNKTKIVTRRQGWKFLKPGDLIQPVEKAQGLKKGEKIKRIGGLVRVLSVKRERIDLIDKHDVTLEGFPHMAPFEFVRMYCRANKCEKTDSCTVIRFEYLGD